MDVEPMCFVTSCILAEGKFTDTISAHAYSTHLSSKEKKKPNSSYYALSVVYFTHYKSNLKKKKTSFLGGLNGKIHNFKAQDLVKRLLLT